MRAYKVLIDGRSGFTGYRWPLPTAGAPGDWVTATGPLELCGNGVHACTVGQLAQWIGEELWTIELGGEILEAEAALVAARGRLLGPVAAWDQAAGRHLGRRVLGARTNRSKPRRRARRSWRRSTGSRRPAAPAPPATGQRSSRASV